MRARALVALVAVTATLAVGCSKGGGGSDAESSPGTTLEKRTTTTVGKGGATTTTEDEEPSTTTTSEDPVTHLAEIGKIADLACSRAVVTNTDLPSDLPPEAVGPAKACVTARKAERAAEQAKAEAEAQQAAAKELDASGMSLEEFNAIQPGMTYNDVVNLVGLTGTLEGDPTLANQTYTWPGDQNAAPGAVATITFLNAGMTTKTQTGLA